MKLLFFGGFIPPISGTRDVLVLGESHITSHVTSTPGEFLKPEAADVHHGRIVVRNTAWFNVTLW